MKADIGIDTMTDFVATSGNVADVTMTSDLVRDEKEPLLGDVGYAGMWSY